MKQYSDADLAELADYAENEERQLPAVSEGRKAYGAIRQGVDWLLRFRARERQRNIENAGRDKENVSVRKTQ
jgi:hypothetical protein